MRSLRVITILAVAALAAAPLFAQSFTEEFEDITTLAGDGWYTQNNSTGIGTTNWGPIEPPMDMRDGGDPDFQGNTAVFPALLGCGVHRGQLQRHHRREHHQRLADDPCGDHQ